MPGSLGTIAGQVKLDVSQAIAAFAASKAASADTVGSLATAGKAIVGVGTVMLGAGLAIGAGFAAAIDAAAKFDAKMSYIQGVSHATADEMDQVRQKAMQLGKDGQFSAAQIADGFVDLAKAGVSVSDMTNGMADAMTNLASAAGVDLNTSVETLVAQLHTYGLATSDAGHVSDELAGTMHASVLSLNDVSGTMKYAGAVAHELGESFDTVSTATAILGKAGIKGSSAGTQLRQILVSLAGSTKPASAELKKLGIITADGSNQFFDSTGKAKDLATVFQILQDKTKGLTQEQQLMAFKTIFNNRALSAAEVLTNAGAQGFANMNAQIQKTTAADVAAKRLDNLKGDVQKLKGSLDTLMIQVGEPFQNMLRGWVQALNKVVNVFVGMSPHTQKLIIDILGFLGVLLTVGGGFLIMAGTAMKAVKTIKEVYGAFKLLVSGIKIVGGAIKLLSIELLTSPIFWIAIAIIAVGLAFYYAYTHSKTFRDIINAIGRAIKTGLMATIHWFEGLPKFFENLWKDITNWFESGVDWVKKKWNELVVIFTYVNTMIKEDTMKAWRAMIDFFKAIPGEVVGFITGAFNAFIGFMNKLPYYIGFALGWVLGTILRFVADASEAVWNFGLAVLKDIITFFEQLPGEVENFFTDMYNRAVKLFKEFVNDTENFAETVYHDVINFFEKLPGEVENFVTDMYHKSLALFDQFCIDTYNFGSTVYHDVTNFFSKLPGEIANFIIDMYHRAVNNFNSFINSASDFATTVYNTVVNFFEKLPGTVENILGQCVDAIKGVITDAFNTAKSFGEGLWNGFKKGLGINSPSYIEKAMWAITKVTDTETKRLGTHVKQMQNLAGAIANTNPAKAAQAANTQRITDLTTSMQQQAKILQTAANSLVPTATRLGIGLSGAAGAPQSAASQSALGGSLSDRAINITVNNPVAEQASDSAARKLRTLTAMGAF